MAFQNITLNGVTYPIDGDRLTNGGVAHSRIGNFLASLASGVNGVVPFVPASVINGGTVNLTSASSLNVIRTASGSGAIDLGVATTFAILANSTITNTGNSVITGSIGLSPGSSITGFPPGTVSGSTLTAGAAATQVAAGVAAYNQGHALTGATVLSASSYELGGTTVTPGLYSIGTSADITGALTLNGAGTYIFQIGSTLTGAVSSTVVLSGGATAANVFFIVGTSATLNGTSFFGTVLANASITVGSAAAVTGHLFANNGAVTLINNAVVATGASSGNDRTIAGAVINLPTSPKDGQQVTFTSTGAITTVTGTVSGALVIDPVTTLAAGQVVKLGYNMLAGVWFRV